MALSKEQIHVLNRINSGAQKACLGNLLAEIEAKATSGGNEKDLDTIKEELNGILETIIGLEETVAGFKEKVNDNTESMSKLTNRLNNFIANQKKSKPSPKTEPSL